MIGDLLGFVAGGIVDGDWKILSRGDRLQKWSARKAVEQLLALRHFNSNALSIRYRRGDRRIAVFGGERSTWVGLRLPAFEVRSAG